MARDLLTLIKSNPGIDTRQAIRIVAAAHHTTLQRASGYLSGLKRRKQVMINVLQPRKQSIAY